jgi:PhzF family phenazine biosynthesis protein
MKSYPFKKLDAFATATSGGNPAAAVYLDTFDAITEAEMQRLARELKGFVSEVGFIARLAPDAFRLRYFSSEKEVQFCGHATIAIAHDLVSQDPELAALPRILLHTNKGVLPVENWEGAVFIHAPVPVYSDYGIPLAEVCKALGLAEAAIDRSIPLGLVNAGNQTLCLPLKGFREVVALQPDFATLQGFCHRYGLDVITVFSEETSDPGNRLRTRVFAAPFGYLEDPATGSGNAALAYHLHRLGRWDGLPFRIEQNADIENPNIVRIASVPDSACGLRVIFGGGAILRIDGRYWL